MTRFIALALVLGMGLATPSQAAFPLGSVTGSTPTLGSPAPGATLGLGAPTLPAPQGSEVVNVRLAEGNDRRHAPGLINVLSYNVHGLFRLAAKDAPRDRTHTIGWLANKYDVVLFQEDFEYHGILSQQMQGSVGVRGNGMGLDPRAVAVKVLLSPLAVFLPHFSPPYGAGVSIFVRSSLAIPDDVDREPYGVCGRWLGENGDCWANKGYLRVGIRTREGAEIDLYTTHLEAGSGEASVATRRAQLDILARAIETLSRDRPVIVGADFNADFKRPADRAAILEFRNLLGLRDSGAGPEVPFWRERDYILYRDAKKSELIIEGRGEAAEFVSRDRALSDHPGLYLRFHVQPRTSDPSDQPTPADES